MRQEVRTTFCFLFFFIKVLVQIVFFIKFLVLCTLQHPNIINLFFIKVFRSLHFATSKHHQFVFFIKVLVLCTLQHPNIIKFLGVCFSPLCFVIEFAPMGSLYDILEKKRAESKTLPVLGPRMTYLILFQVCLHYLFQTCKYESTLNFNFFFNHNFSLVFYQVFFVYF